MLMGLHKAQICFCHSNIYLRAEEPLTYLEQWQTMFDKAA